MRRALPSIPLFAAIPAGLIGCSRNYWPDWIT
jgi:hypothetical protein